MANYFKLKRNTLRRSSKAFLGLTRPSTSFKELARPFKAFQILPRISSQASQGPSTSFRGFPRPCMALHGLPSLCKPFVVQSLRRPSEACQYFAKAFQAVPHLPKQIQGFPRSSKARQDPASLAKALPGLRRLLEGLTQAQGEPWKALSKPIAGSFQDCSKVLQFPSPRMWPTLAPSLATCLPSCGHLWPKMARFCRVRRPASEPHSTYVVGRICGASLGYVRGVCPGTGAAKSTRPSLKIETTGMPKPQHTRG